MAKRPSFVIDADSHVEEADAVWDFLDPAFAHRKPQVIERAVLPTPYQQDAFWLIDGQTFPRPYGMGAIMFGTPVASRFAKGKKFSIESQTLLPAAARVADMDKLGLDVQVIYPTIFLDTLSQDVAFETALMKSYNTWLAQTCAQFPNRLKWAAMIPLRNPRDGARELARAKAMGAVCGLIYGTAGEKVLHDPEMDEIWAEAEKQDMALSVHTGWNMTSLLNKMDSVYCSTTLGVVPSMFGLFSILGGGILDRFPKLRFGFFEAGADWLPYMITRMERLWSVYDRNKWPGIGPNGPRHWLQNGNIWFCVEGNEQFLPQVVELLGEGNLMTSADLPHDEALDGAIEEIQGRSDVSDTLKTRILTDNPQRYYGL